MKKDLIEGNMCICEHDRFDHVSDGDYLVECKECTCGEYEE